MKTDLFTLEHPFCIRGNLEILSAAGEVPIHDSLQAATEYLEAVVHGLRDLMGTPEVSNLATLTFFAAETALALVYSAAASVNPSTGGDV
jgi:hypothetical protein